MARLVYTLLLLLIAPAVPLYLLWRARRQPEYLQHWNERWGFYPRTSQAPQDVRTIWLHAVSVGETRATQPLVKLLRQRWPQARILITHMTPTGRQTSADLYGDGVVSAYLPYDYPWAMRQFLRHFRPQLGIVMETELWPNLVAACRADNIPLLLANARLSEKSARGYARFPNLTRQALQALAAVAAQTAEDAARLTRLGARDVQVFGNLKFDITPPPEQLALGAAWHARWGGRRVLLTASTREGEEELILDAYRSRVRPDLLLVIVPRHPQRFAAVAAMVTARGLHLARRSVTTAPGDDVQVLLGDSMGEMFAYYAACDVACIGGSLLDYGSQNLIEACAVGVPVLIGPSTYNFAEAARAALDAGAAQQVRNAEEMIARALELLDTQLPARHGATAGEAFTARHRGASERTLRLVERLLD